MSFVSSAHMPDARPRHPAKLLARADEVIE
jgi:hypothetical protein